MKRILFTNIFISILLLSACDKNADSYTPNVPEMGTLQLTSTYIGRNTANWCNFYVCDTKQQDVVSNYILQISTAYANGNHDGGQALGDALRQILQPLRTINGYSNALASCCEINVGTYIVLAERWVEYYVNGERVINTMAWQYQVAQVTRSNTTPVSFIFQDYSIMQ